MNNVFDIIKHMDLIEAQFGYFYRDFRHFDRIMAEWREAFALASEEVRNPLVAKIKMGNKEELVSETYQQELVFDQDRVFQFEWDIVFATYDLKQRGPKSRDIELFPYLPFIDKTQLSFSNPESRQPYFPIILLNAHEVLNTHIMLNGNHRMIEAYQKGKSSVKGYYIDDLTHLKWMTTDKMQAVYEFLKDMKVIDYVLTLKDVEIDHDKLYKQLIISRLYPKLMKMRRNNK